MKREFDKRDKRTIRVRASKVHFSSNCQAATSKKEAIILRSTNSNLTFGT